MGSKIVEMVIQVINSGQNSLSIIAAGAMAHDSHLAVSRSNKLYATLCISGSAEKLRGVTRQS